MNTLNVSKNTESISTKLTNKKILMTSLIAMTFIVTFSGQSAFAQVSANGGDGITTELAVAVDGNWVKFFFSGEGSDSGQFEFDCSAVTECTIMVTDGFLAGDIFEILVDGESVGLTSVVPEGPEGCIDPAACFPDADYSSGTFQVSKGEHTMTIVAETSPFGGGGAWFKLTHDLPIGGYEVPVSSTSLLVAGAQANMGLMSLALVGIVGAAAAVTYKIKSKKTEQ